MSDNGDMLILTCEYLRERLSADGIDFRAVATEAEVSEKTLYRIRHGKNKPSLDTAQRIVLALNKLQKDAKKAARAA